MVGALRDGGRAGEGDGPCRNRSPRSVMVVAALMLKRTGSPSGPRRRMYLHTVPHVH